MQTALITALACLARSVAKQARLQRFDSETPVIGRMTYEISALFVNFFNFLVGLKWEKLVIWCGGS